jgi:hypothetical protein
MRGRLVLLMALAALALASSANTARTATGLHGFVAAPRPVCIEGRPCSEPTRGIVLVFRRGGVTVRTTTRANGAYRVFLRRGLYTVSAVGGPPIARVTPSTVRVLPGRVARVDFELDRGLQ